MTTDAEDRSAWPRNGQVIRRDELLRLIEENGRPWDLDLRGAVFMGDGASDYPPENPIDLSPGALRPHLETYKEKQQAEARPPWLSLEGSIALNGAHLEKANLWGADLERADLNQAHLGKATLHSAYLRNASLIAAHLEKAILLATHFECAYLRRTHLQNADVRYAHLENADLWEAHLENASLRGAHLENADLSGARLGGAFWYECYLGRTRMRRESLGQAIGEEIEAHKEKAADAYHRAKEAYLLLKNNFNQIGRYEDASWAYVKEQQMEKMAFHWEWRWQFWHRWGSFWRWLRNWAYELLTGYGEWVHMPVVWAFVVVALFTAIYAGAGNVSAGDVGALEGQPTHSPITALVHSISAFATIGFNTLEPQGWGARLLTAVEAMFGIGLFALFVFTLGNRMRRS